MMLGRAVVAQGRTLSTVASNSVRAIQERDMKLLNDFFPTVVRELQEESTCCNIPSETESMGKLLMHTVPGGKMIRALATYHCMRELAPDCSFGDELYQHKAKCLAWSVEMLQSFLAVMDDMADESPRRRGRMAWHVMVGPAAVFDGLLVEHASYRLLARHFQGELYSRIMQLYVNTIFEDIFGQNYDIHCMTADRAKLKDFSIERYRTLSDSKSGADTFYLPVAAALVANGWNQPATFAAARDLAFDIGHIYQVQDDCLDMYGTQEKMGKQRTDIKNGKCTWLIVQAREHANSEQLKILEANYGFDDPEKVQRVADLYNELQLKELFLAFEKDSFDAIKEKINKYSDVLPPALYTYVFECFKHHINK